MDEITLARFAHEHFHALINIDGFMSSVMRTFSAKDDVSNPRKYYFEKIASTIQNLTRLGDELYSRIEVDQNLSYYCNRLKLLFEPLKVYLTSENKFYPILLSDKLLEVEQFLPHLNSPNYSQELHFLTLEIEHANLILNEFFLREAYQLIQYAKESARDTLTKLDNDLKDAQYSALNLIDIVEGHIKSEQANSDRKKINVRRDYDLKNCFVYGFKSDLTRAIGNLVNNAIKYNDTVKNYDVYIKIKIYKLGETLMLEIENWGPGIDSDELDDELVFQRSFRGRQAEKRGIYGNGIGLYDAKKGIEKCRGQIEITSEKVAYNNQYITTAIVTLNAVPLAG